MAILLQLHELVDFDCGRFADAVDVVPSKVKEHDMLRSILLGGEQSGS
jgi:hypothetical protein